MRKSYPVVVAALPLTTIAQSALGILALASQSRCWTNTWLLSFAIFTFAMSSLLAWLIRQTRSSLWKVLGSSKHGSRALEYLEIAVESAMPVALLGIIYASVSFVVYWSAPTGVMSALIVNMLYFAVLSLWPQVLIFRRTITLNRLHQRPTYHESPSSIFQPKPPGSALDFGGQLEMVESSLEGRRERTDGDIR
ncbi:hypothetical protein BKA70DRAFT_490270 [Coprinopsis sp. MPI-PUGE-AT-0042]|nr:hypothetical protein BKA70DRAFT_490270 [Coprinopsis sp. MPI-PUGE-AT-0042]